MGESLEKAISDGQGRRIRGDAATGHKKMRRLPTGDRSIPYLAIGRFHIMSSSSPRWRRLGRAPVKLPEAMGA
jgi:hypothetical protein